jgi:hypothetical protein
VEEQEDEIEELKASRRRKALSGPERDKGGMRDRDRQWGRGWESGRGRSRGDNQLPDARPQSQPHVATSRGFKRSSDMAGSSQGWFRDGDGEMREEIDGDDRSYASEAGDRSPNCDDSPVADKHANTSRSRSNMENNGSSSNSNSNSRRRTSGSNNQDRSAYSYKGSRQGGPSDRDRDIVEETLAMQTMSLIHGQLTAMKHQLLTISDVSTIPDTECDVTRSQGRPSQVQRKDSSFQSK